MRSLILLIPAVIMIAGVSQLAACNDEDPPDEAGDIAILAKMEAEVDGLIGEAACKDVKECRSIAFGAKPCGGPWKFKIYSVTGLDTTQLASKVDAYNKLNAAFNARHGWMSDCMVVTQPNLGCVEGNCVAVE
jgi:hypothetical protein